MGSSGENYLQFVYCNICVNWHYSFLVRCCLIINWICPFYKTCRYTFINCNNVQLHNRCTLGCGAVVTYTMMFGQNWFLKANRLKYNNTFMGGGGWGGFMIINAMQGDENSGGDFDISRRAVSISMLPQPEYWAKTMSTGYGAMPAGHPWNMMTSSNGNIFRVTGHLCGEFPAQRPVTQSFDVFFDLRPNKRLSKHWRGWWFETPSCPLCRHCNEMCWLCRINCSLPSEVYQVPAKHRVLITNANISYVSWQLSIP